MQTDYTALIEQQRHYIEKVLLRDKLRIPRLLFSSKLRNTKKQYEHMKHFENKRDDEFLQLAALTDGIDRNGCYRFLNKALHIFNDFIFECKYRNNNIKIKKEMRKSGRNYLSIVCIIKNEALYIDEWIAFNKIIGVDHIYLFNNGSTDNIKDVIVKHVQSGYVTFIDFKGANAQLPLYRLTIRALKKISRWVAFIDADEFIIPTDCTLKEYMKKQEDYPGIGINWIVYGTGGHIKRPEGLVTENYLLTFEDPNNPLNLRIKSIVNPKETYDVSSPHFCILKKGKYAVDEDGNEITAKWMYTSGSGPAFTEKNKTNKIRINHYWTKSEQDLHDKCNRGYAAGSFSPDYENIMKRLDYPQKVDNTIGKYVPKIKETMLQK